VNGTKSGTRRSSGRRHAATNPYSAGIANVYARGMKTVQRSLRLKPSYVRLNIGMFARMVVKKASNNSMDKKNRVRQVGVASEPINAK